MLDEGQGLQADNAASLTYSAAAFADVSVEVKTLLRAGSLTLTVRQSDTNSYAASLAADGHAELRKNGEMVNGGTLTVSSDTWVTMRFSVIGDIVSLYVDDVLLVTATDALPLSAGMVIISASDASLLRIDDAVINSVPLAPTVISEPTPVPTSDSSVPPSASLPAAPPLPMALTCPRQRRLCRSQWPMVG